MKNKNKIIFSFLAVFMCAGLVLGGCQASSLENYKNQVSDIRENYFAGQSDNFYASFTSGMRESPYAFDGISEEKVEFGVLTIQPKQTLESTMLGYTISIDDQKYSGFFEESPFDNSYSADIEQMVDDSASITITITDGQNEESISLECISCDFEISAENALDLAYNELQEDLQALCQDKGYEVYVKIVADLTQNVQDKYWLVLFYCECGDSISAIISTTDGTCLAKKTSWNDINGKDRLK